MIVRRAGRMREFPHTRRILARRIGRLRRPITLQNERRQRLDTVGASGKLNGNAASIGMAAVSQTRISRIAFISWAESGIALRRLRREFVIGAETEIVEIVIRLDDEAFIGELGLKMQGIGRTVADLEGAEEWPPARTVGMDRPNAP